jgi:hypothetical protein
VLTVVDKGSSLLIEFGSGIVCGEGHGIGSVEIFE